MNLLTQYHDKYNTGVMDRVEFG